MFTGIITDIGKVTDISGPETSQGGGKRLVIHCHYPLQELTPGASIACDGACLTVTGTGNATEVGYSAWFSADISRETLDCTHIGNWQRGYGVNLERALGLGAELGGHLVTGHVDGLAEILDLSKAGESLRVVFRIPESWKNYVAAKGSVTLNGVSLTVNRVMGTEAEVNIIPHTLQNTNLSGLEKGGQVHFEVDLIARYLGRLLEGRK